jgi:hypothetical protein
LPTKKERKTHKNKDDKRVLCKECDECLFDDNTKCTNSEYCGERRVLQMEYMNRKERDSNDYMYENESVSDLVTIGRVVAVLADDDEYDYYLMKVSKVPLQFERVENDDWVIKCPVVAYAFWFPSEPPRDHVCRFESESQMAK